MSFICFKKGHFLEKEISDPDVYVKEFRNQILDFIASNPPRFGTNWFSTMDVGIRVSNWLVAYDLFKAFGVSFDPEFERIFGFSFPLFWFVNSCVCGAVLDFSGFLVWRGYIG